MRILVLSNLCPPDYDGGFELSAYRLSNQLRARGHEVTIVTSEFRDKFRGDRSPEPHVHRIFRLAKVTDGWSTHEDFLTGKNEQESGGLSLSKLRKELPLRLQNIRSIHETLKLAPGNEAAMEKFLAEHEFDVCYCFGLHLIGTSVTRPLTRRNVPVVYHYGDEWLAVYVKPNRLKRLILTALHPLLYRRECDIDLRNVILISEFMRKRFLHYGFTKEQTSVIYRGVEFELGRDVDRARLEPPTFVYASRLALYKGTHIAIRAAGLVHQRDPQRPWNLIIAGGGDPEAEALFRNLVRENGIESRVEFRGKLKHSETLALMREGVAFLSCSVFDEPLGNTNLEAMASGTPLIGSRTGAMEEIIDDGVSGLLYDRASPEELAGHMMRLLDDPELRRQIARGGVEKVERKFLMSKILDETEAAFRLAIAGRPVSERETGS